MTVDKFIFNSITYYCKMLSMLNSDVLFFLHLILLLDYYFHKSTSHFVCDSSISRISPPTWSCRVKMTVACHRVLSNTMPWWSWDTWSKSERTFPKWVLPVFVSSKLSLYPRIPVTQQAEYILHKGFAYSDYLPAVEELQNKVFVHPKDLLGVLSPHSSFVCLYSQIASFLEHKMFVGIYNILSIRNSKCEI